MNDKNPEHDLFDFMRQVASEINSEYHRIRKRSKEDPGTAGDQGEENWRNLLEDWLPQKYHVVTKGRIISHDGSASPQIDILVLDSVYPKRLLGKKVYLASGVVAAFECKNTLKSIHISEAINTAKIVKAMATPRVGTPYKEIHSEIVYGLLSHSHSWKAAQSSPQANIEKTIIAADIEVCDHPRQQLDIICVADLGTWSVTKIGFMPPGSLVPNEDHKVGFSERPSVSTQYVECSERLKGMDMLALTTSITQTTPIGSFLTRLLTRLAWEDSSLRGLSRYFKDAGVAGVASGEMRFWDFQEVYSKNVQEAYSSQFSPDPKAWSEWSFVFS